MSNKVVFKNSYFPRPLSFQLYPTTVLLKNGYLQTLKVTQQCAKRYTKSQDQWVHFLGVQFE